jgi:hypothetical protein
MIRTMRLGISYVPNLSMETQITKDLAHCMIASTEYKLRKAIFYCSGTHSYLHM